MSYVWKRLERALSDEILAQVLTGVFTLAGTAAGIASGAAGGWLDRRRVRHSAHGQALSALLEVRFRLLTLKRQARLFAQLPKEYGPVWAALALESERLLPDLSPLQDSYAAAVEFVAAEDPMLAYRLRFREHDPAPRLREMAVALSAEEPPAEFVSALTSMLRDAGTKAIDDAIMELAWAHSLTAWWRARATLRRKLDDSAEMRDMMTRLVEELVSACPQDEAAIRAALAHVAPAA